MLPKHINEEILTLAIDTSCDETSVSVVRGVIVLSNVLPSQTELHAQYGGVVPSIARLAHQERIDGVVDLAMKKAKVKFEDLDFIAVTIGPGLSIALEVGIRKAKELSRKYDKPLVTVNHMEGHLLSAFAERNFQLDQLTQAPKKQKHSDIKDVIKMQVDKNVLGLLVSGKHTELLKVKAIGEYELIGETHDDACGEAFDKCGRLLGFGYPAGPVLADFAKKHRKNMELKLMNQSQGHILRVSRKDEEGKFSKAKSKTQNLELATYYDLPIPMSHADNFDFSYSGLKTAFNQVVKKLTLENNINNKENLEVNLSKDQILDLCVAFEEAAFKQIEFKVEKALKEFGFKEIWLGGGVSASTRLRQILRNLGKKYGAIVRYPTNKKLTTDNAAMIGVAANLRLVNNQITPAKGWSAYGGKSSNIQEAISETLRLSPMGHRQSLGIYLSSEFDLVDRDPSLPLG